MRTPPLPQLTPTLSADTNIYHGKDTDTALHTTEDMVETEVILQTDNSQDSQNLNYGNFFYIYFKYTFHGQSIKV